MKKAFLLVFACAFLLSGCGLIAPAAQTEAPQETQASYTFTEDDFPKLEGSAALEPLGAAVTAIMLGKSMDEASAWTDFGSTEAGCADLLTGDCGVALALRPPETVSMDGADEAVIARDALVFYVSRTNTVDDLTSAQLRGIYDGSITNWSEVGGSDMPITVFGRSDWSGTRAALERLLLDGGPAAAETGWFPDGSGGLTAETAAFDGSDGAIGFGVYYYTSVMQMADGYKLLSVDGVTPSDETIESGGYPLLTDYCAYVAADAAEDGPERTLWRWLQSAAGQAFIASRGYVPAQEG